MTPQVPAHFPNDALSVRMPGLPRQKSLGFDSTGQPAALEPVGSQI